MYVLGIGTGIGYAQISFNTGNIKEGRRQVSDYFFNEKEKSEAYVLASEGCNCLYQARTEKELEILEFMRTKWKKQNLNFEEVWCGEAIQYLYEFFGGEEREELTNKEVI